MRFGFAGNIQKDGIEKVIVHRLRVDQEEPLGIRVYAALERQIGQHRTGKQRVLLMRRERVSNAAALGIQDQ